MEEEPIKDVPEQQGIIESADTIQGIETTTLHDHFYEDGGLNENKLMDVICLSCGHGIQVDPRTRIEEGKLIFPSV